MRFERHHDRVLRHGGRVIGQKGIYIYTGMPICSRLVAATMLAIWCYGATVFKSTERGCVISIVTFWVEILVGLPAFILQLRPANSRPKSFNYTPISAQNVCVLQPFTVITPNNRNVYSPATVSTFLVNPLRYCRARLLLVMSTGV